MANKKFWFGMLVILLVFGMAVIACNRAGNLINGTWVRVDNPDLVHTFRNGNWESTLDGRPAARGTYTIRGNSYTSRFTHLYGSTWDSSLESRWYTRDEILASGLFYENIRNLFDNYRTDIISVDRYVLVFTTEDGRVLTNTRIQEGGIRGSITGINQFEGTWAGSHGSEFFELVVMNTMVELNFLMRSDFAPGGWVIKRTITGDHTHRGNTATFRFDWWHTASATIDANILTLRFPGGETFFLTRQH